MCFLKRNHVGLLEIFEWCALSRKVHSLSVAPEPLAVWNKELEGLGFELFEELRIVLVAAPEHISGFFYSKKLG